MNIPKSLFARIFRDFETDGFSRSPGDPRPLVRHEAGHPENASGILENGIPVTPAERNLAVYVEIAQFLSSVHPEWDQPVALLPGSSADGKTDPRQEDPEIAPSPLDMRSRNRFDFD